VIKCAGSVDAEEREFFKKILNEKYGIQDKRVIFVKIPTMTNEPASALVLLNVKGTGKKLLPFVTEAEDAWDSYKDEYQNRELTHEEFKKAVIEVSSHLG
jgi:tubulin gamma